ncbi:hypothetical protein D3C74_294940 [compost metagenome]
MRQHRDDPVHQIDAAPAVKSFLIQLRPFTHIISNVSNMHAQLVVAVLQTRYIHSIIQILGVRTVNGDNVQPAKIAASLLDDLFLRN